MTREEAIKQLEDLDNCYNQLSNNDKDALDMAIKALEQEPVLDKIRAEIDEYKSRQLALAIGVEDLEKGKQIALEYVLALIDKYKSEREVEE